MNERYSLKRRRRAVTRRILLVLGCIVILFFSCLISYIIARWVYKSNYEQETFVRNGSEIYNNSSVEADEIIHPKNNGGSDKVKNSVLEGKVIVVDAGHGGKDQGTSYGNILEKDVVLSMGKYVMSELERRGATVIMTRTDDEFLELEQRADIANNAGADVFVCLHIDYYEGGEDVNGLTCHYMPDSSEGKELAECLAQSVQNSGIINVRDCMESDFSVLRNTDMPAVLIETGFLSSQTDRERLIDTSYQQQLASSLADGLEDYFK